MKPKNLKIIFWVTTIILFLFEGVMVALTSQTEFAKTAILHLGYPLYFSTELAVLKVLGSLALVLPQVPARVKEWAYAGFGITIISAFVANWAVDGLTPMLLMPIVFFGILLASYCTYHKLNDKKA